MLERTVTLSHPGLVGWINRRRATNQAAELTPASMAVTNALREIVVLPLSDARFSWPDDAGPYSLRLDPELGVVYKHDEEILP